jgi:tRNA/tmRNA/rRNA uracil-C5-methylase (TrmA/RlmC/RlmD family)
MPWARAMGAAACHAVTRFLIDHTACRTVVDPFCGVGTMLAVANAAGLDAVGVELSPKRAARARTLTAADLRDRKAARSSAD